MTWDARWAAVRDSLRSEAGQGLDSFTLAHVHHAMDQIEIAIPEGAVPTPVGDWQPMSMRVEGIWLAMKPGCPIARCDWGTTVTSINTPDGRVDPASDALALLLGTIEHLREDHEAAYPWEDHAGQDQRVTIQLEPPRLDRLIEVLRSAGAHPSGLGSYVAAADALALAEDISNMAERQR